MNKIKIENDIVVDAQLSSKVKLSFLEKNENFMVNKIVIDVIGNTKLEIFYYNESALKLDILIRIAEGIKTDILEIRTGKQMKIQYRYELDTNSTLKIQKFHHITGIKELDTIYLNGSGAQIDYLLKTLSTAREKYDITVHHKADHTKSLIHSHGVNILEGTIQFHVSGIIPNGKKGCELNQNNRIINLSDQTCSIQPDLFIDEYDVIASHSAHIGTFREEELFYLESRGIKKEEATRLLVKGFLFSNLDLPSKRKKEAENIIDQYWR